MRGRVMVYRMKGRRDPYHKLGIIKIYIRYE